MMVPCLSPAPPHKTSKPSRKRICDKTVSHLRRKREWIDEESTPTAMDDPLLLEEPALASVYQASLRGRIFMGERHGFKVVRIQGTAASGGGYKRGVSGNAFNL